MFCHVITEMMFIDGENPQFWHVGFRFWSIPVHLPEMGLWASNGTRETTRFMGIFLGIIRDHLSRLPSNLAENCLDAFDRTEFILTGVTLQDPSQFTLFWQLEASIYIFFYGGFHPWGYPKLAKDESGWFRENPIYKWMIKIGLPSWLRTSHPKKTCSFFAGFLSNLAPCCCLKTTWLVVQPPLWKIWKSIGMKFPICGKLKLMFQTTNQQLCKSNKQPEDQLQRMGEGSFGSLSVPTVQEVGDHTDGLWKHETTLGMTEIATCFWKLWWNCNVSTQY